MTIKEERPISMPEVFELAGETEKGKQIKDFIKGFNNMRIKDARNLIDDLNGLKIMKLKDAFVVKIVDFMPIDASELNKVLSGV
jgi:DNA-directed RNA polymerase subunit F